MRGGDDRAQLFILLNGLPAHSRRMRKGKKYRNNMGLLMTKNFWHC